MAKKKELTYLILIDASGSMSERGKLEEVRAGIKMLLTSVKEEALANKNKQNILVCDFSSSGDFRVLVNTSEVNELDVEKIAKEYATRSLTALRDAMGQSFSLVKEKQNGVFVSVITDGLENDSKEFSSSAIKAKLEELKAKGWVFKFVGTTQDQIEEAEKMGFHDTTLVSNDAKGMSRGLMAISASMRSFSNKINE